MNCLHNRFYSFGSYLSLLACAALLSACGASSPLPLADEAGPAIIATEVSTEVPSEDSAITDPHVFFVEPEDDAIVQSPVKVIMGVENLTLAPAGVINPGHGHLHIIVDGDCTPSGEIIIKDETHLHFGDGQSEAELELTAGEHTLCLQAADGVHSALAGASATQVIKVTVE